MRVDFERIDLERLNRVSIITWAKEAWVAVAGLTTAVISSEQATSKCPDVLT